VPESLLLNTNSVGEYTIDPTKYSKRNKQKLAVLSSFQQSQSGMAQSAEASSQLHCPSNPDEGRIGGDGGDIDFHTLACEIDGVSEFVKAVCRLSFPRGCVWGSRYNERIFLSFVDCYIRLGRFETLTTNQIIRKLRLRDLLFIGSSAQAPDVEECTELIDDLLACDDTVYEESRKRKCSRNSQTSCDGDTSCCPPNSQHPQASQHPEALRSVIYWLHWIFADFINPLISSCFYVTEGQGTAMETLYYRKPIWAQLMSIGKVQMSQNFVEISYVGPRKAAPLLSSSIAAPLSTSCMSGSLMHLPAVRFIPKKSSIRAITNFKGTLANSVTGPDTQGNGSVHTSSTFPSSPEIVSNATLYNCLHVLKSIVHRKPECVGFGVIGLDEAHTKLRAYYESFKQANLHASGFVVAGGGVNPELECKAEKLMRGKRFYCAALDLEKCFDNIDTKQLYDVVRALVLGVDQPPVSALSSAGKAMTPAYNADHEEFLIHKYFLTRQISSIERPVTRTIRHVTHPDDMLTFRGLPVSVSFVL
jgi:hypothetical protein